MQNSSDLFLVIDFQNVYLPGQEWACPSMPKAMENTLKILSSPKAPDTLFTRFLAADSPMGTWQDYNREYRLINEDPFLCDLASPVKEAAARYPVAVKSAYSSLKCPPVLKAAEGKTRLVLAGVVAECCILATMMEAIDLGFQVLYLYDCISGQSAENEASIRRIAESFSPMHTLVLSADEYLATVFP